MAQNTYRLEQYHIRVFNQASIGDSILVFSGVVGSSSGRGGVRSQKSEDAAIAGSHQSSFYTYEDYGGWNIFSMQIFQTMGSLAISHCRDIALRELRGKLLRELKREKSRPQLERLAKDSRPSMSKSNRVTIAEATRPDKRLNYFSD